MATEVLVRNELHDKGTRTGQWTVVVDGRIVSSHRMKRRAIERARREGRRRAPAVLKIQDTMGRWRTEASYR